MKKGFSAVGMALEAVVSKGLEARLIKVIWLLSPLLQVNNQVPGPQGSTLPPHRNGAKAHLNSIFWVEHGTRLVRHQDGLSEASRP